MSGDEFSALRSGRFTPGERAPGTHWIEYWVGSRAGLPGIEPRFLGNPAHRPVTKPTELSRFWFPSWAWLIQSTASQTSPLKSIATLSSGRAMAQAVSRRPLTAEARVWSRVNPCGICGGQSGTRKGFSPRVLRFSPLNFIPPVLHYTEKQKKKNESSSSQGCRISLKAAVRP
jgi:hypothetical protein